MKGLVNKSLLYTAVTSTVLLAGCAGQDTRGTLGSLKDVKFEVKEEKVDGSLEKAMQSYEEFLKETPETAMTPEAVRRLADLKIQKDYTAEDTSIQEKSADEEAEAQAEQGTGDLPEAKASTPVADSAAQSTEMSTPETGHVPVKKDREPGTIANAESPIADISESEKAFAERAGKKIELGAGKQEKIVPPGGKPQDAVDAQQAGAKEAIELYKGLLEKYPLFERNDQVLYQLSRAYEEIGQVDIAMVTLERLIREYPQSRHIDEAQFRRAEYFFTRKKYIDAEEAYQAVINNGEGSEFYELALYKQGWAFFKQELYEEALHDYIRMLDYKIANGYDLDNIENKIEKKRVDDTYRVISLSFSYLGGPDAIVEYFDKHGHRFYEASIYSHLGEYYLKKRRYADASKSYQTYIDKNPITKEAPYFNIRIIEIYKEGGFPKLVVDAKRDFSKTYALQANFWTFFDINEHPQVLAFLKSNLIDLANHYHALYLDKRLAKEKEKNYEEAISWYKQFLGSFPEDVQAPNLNNQLAELYLENKDYLNAAVEYERTAYNYPTHEKSASAGYAAVYAYREYLKVVSQAQRNVVKREVIRSSLKFQEVFPTHKNAAVVLVAAVEDLYALEDYEQAIVYGRKAIKVYPEADRQLRRSAWNVVADASFDTANYKDAEDAYIETLALTDKQAKSYASLTENLAASVYKQGEQARTLGDYKTAAAHFLRVAQVAPNSKIRPTAEYDAAAALMQLKEWGRVAVVLEGFRKLYPDNPLMPDITKKLAVVYKEDGKFLKAAEEFERIEKENPEDDALRREALGQSAELYEKAKAKDRALLVYIKLVNYFPEPIEDALEVRQKIADIYKANGDDKKYRAELKQIVDADANGGAGRTDRTRYLAANAALVLAEPKLSAFKEIKLVQPFKKNLKRKKEAMRNAIDTYTKLVDYHVGKVTAAATYYIAEIYYEFSVALIKSERPTNLNAEELAQYDEVIEEQAYPFEEKAIEVHVKNLELLDAGIYNEWIDNSLARLAKLSPARYGKSEQPSEIVALIQPPKPKPAGTEGKPVEPKASIVPAATEQPDATPEVEQAPQSGVDESAATPAASGDQPTTTQQSPTVVDTNEAAQSKPEQVEPEQTVSEEVQPEQTQQEQTQPEQVAPEAAQPEQGAPEAAQPEQIQQEQTQTEQVTPEQSAPEAAQPEQVEPEQSASEEVQPGQTPEEQTQTEQVAPEAAQKEQGAPEAAQPEQLQQEQIEPEQTETQQTESAPANVDDVNNNDVNSNEAEQQAPEEAAPSDTPTVSEPVQDAAPVEATDTNTQSMLLNETLIHYQRVSRKDTLVNYIETNAFKKPGAVT